MKLKTIAQLCKKRKCYFLFDKPSDAGGITQWLGDGCAAYILDGMPLLNKESLCRVLDIVGKQQEKMILRQLEVPEGLCLDDTDPGEAMVERMEPGIYYNGKELLPLLTREGIVFIQKRYLSPFDGGENLVELYTRKTNEGQTYIAVKAGLLIRAVIFPVNVVDAKFMNQIGDLVRECRRVIEKPEAEEQNTFQLSWEEEEPGSDRT